MGASAPNILAQEELWSQTGKLGEELSWCQGLCPALPVRLQFLLASFCMQRSRVKDGAEGKQTAEGKLANGSEDDWYVGQGYVSRLWEKSVCCLQDLYFLLQELGKCTMNKMQQGQTPGIGC